MAAQDIKNLKKVTYQLVEAEERGILIRNLISQNVGFREEEEFRIKEGRKFKGGREFDSKKATIKLAMKEKQRDNIKIEGKLRRLRTKAIKKIEDNVGRNTQRLRRILEGVRTGTRVVRKRIKQKFKNKERFLVKKYGIKNMKMSNEMLAELSNVDQSKYGECKMFSEDQLWTPEEAIEISVVCGPEQSVIIDEDERNLLKLGPKFCILANLDEEKFENELEQTIMKVKWDCMSDDEKKRKRSLCDIAIYCVQDEDQREECRVYEEIKEAKSRMIYDNETNSLDFSKRRTTDLKNNARVIFPKSKDFQEEAKYELLRIEAMGVFRNYVSEKCGKGGKQMSNLSKSEEGGLKKLKKRTKDGDIVVLPTDKTGNFAVMDRGKYEEAGLAHVKEDKLVGWEELRTAQKELNGHMAMLIKIFKIGDQWGHGSRVRETMMGESLESCPVHLLYKDHKGWDQSKGGVPPTRHVAGGNRGINLHLSEVVSDILEPMVDRVEGGSEVISTEDTLARFEDVSLSMVGWTSTSWWEGRTMEGWISCGKCKSMDGYLWDETRPSLCRCDDEQTWEGDRTLCQKGRQEDDDQVCSDLIEDKVCQEDHQKYDHETCSGGQVCDDLGVEEVRQGGHLVDNCEACMDGQVCDDLSEDEVCQGGHQEYDREACSVEQDSTNQSEDGVWREGYSKGKKCTYDFMKTLRRLRWEISMDWEDEDLDRIITSNEALEEDLQDYSVPMVVVGGDVVSLYPNLDVDSVVERIKDEVMRTDMKFTNIDYLEAARYLVLNWSVEESRSSGLRRILPTRKGKRGTKPGIRGAGPRGKLRGDQEQWSFKEDLVLEDWEKKQIVAEVIKLATKTMFNRHFYTFGGRTYHQRGGGPIGLRGTCAVARLIMQIFDRKWGGLLKSMGVKYYDLVRYMDDIRMILPPFKCGWRWVEGNIMYCKRWEIEDVNLSAIERTRRVLAGSMEKIEPYLRFTTETEEDFRDGWLPTLDTAVKVSPQNKILFRFYEKPTNSNRTLDKRTAMGEDQKIQVLTQEVVRRLGNTTEDLSNEDYVTILDDFSQKLCNSGYGVDQIRRIMVAGIKGWGGRVNRCRQEGRRLRRTARESKELRMRTKLTGKTSWFKKRGGQKRDWYGGTKHHFRSKTDGKGGRSTTIPTSVPKSVIFVEQTPGGELAKRLRELLTRIEPTVGFSIKVVERSGRSLQSLFPLTSLWDGAACGRKDDCTTCYQGAEMLPNCTRQSILYENVCSRCVPKAKEDKELRDEDLGRGEHPKVYVGETSRSITERSREHWASYRGGGGDNHMWRHQEMVHGGEPADFTMRVVGSYKSALSRQIGEAVRIRRRGGEGSILNSKSEYNRCHIPRLRVEDKEEEKKRDKKELEIIEKIEEELDREQDTWEHTKTWTKDQERRCLVKQMVDSRELGKRREEDDKPDKGAEGAPRKKLKYGLLKEDWGEAPKPREQENPNTVGSRSLGEEQVNQSIVEGAPARSNITIPTIHTTTHQEEGGAKLVEGFDTIASCQPQPITLTQQKISDFLLPRGRVDILEDPPDSHSGANDDSIGGGSNVVKRANSSTSMEGGVPMEVGGQTISQSMAVEEAKDNITKCPSAPSMSQEVTQGEMRIIEDDIIGRDEPSSMNPADGVVVVDGTDDMKVDTSGNMKTSVENKVDMTTKMRNMSSMRQDGDGNMCVFKRGICQEHKIKGTKMTTKRQVWKKRKYDYGYVTVSKTTYSCVMTSTHSTEPDKIGSSMANVTNLSPAQQEY